MTRMRSATALMIAAGWPGVAVATEVKPNDQIVVTGKTANEVRKETKQFVKEVGHASGNVQAARWVDAVCPTAIGVSADVKLMIESRVREVAKSVGARVAKSNCSPNLAIVFSNTANSQKILRNYSMLPRDLQADASIAAAGKDLPIRWWYNAEKAGTERPQDNAGAAAQHAYKHPVAHVHPGF